GGGRAGVCVAVMPRRSHCSVKIGSEATTWAASTFRAMGLNCAVLAFTCGGTGTKMETKNASRLFARTHRQHARADRGRVRGGARCPGSPPPDPRKGRRGNLHRQGARRPRIEAEACG